MLSIVGALLFTGTHGMSLDEYQCSFCVPSVQEALDTGLDLQTSCAKFFPSEICSKFGLNFALATELNALNARDICVNHALCEPLDPPRFSSTTTTDYDLRVTKALGSRGYDKVRISVISNATIPSDLFSYSEPFQYRWTQNVLNTGIVTVQPGQKTPITIGSQTFEIYIPLEGEGVRGILLGDPCFTSEFITCLYAKEFDMFNHTIELLNAANSHDDTNFWMILGDNFYDQSGYVDPLALSTLISLSLSHPLLPSSANNRMVLCAFH
jgi:hypothetical protein